MLNSFSNTRSDFWKIGCIRYRHMKEPELKTARHRLGWLQARLAAAVGIAVGSVAPQGRGELGLSEPMVKLQRLIEGGAEVEAFAHQSRSRRDRAFESTKSFDAADPKSQGRKRPRKDFI